MLRFLLALVLVAMLPFTFFGKGASVDWAVVHEKTTEAIRLIHDMEYRKAEGMAHDVIVMAPNDPRGHFAKAMVYYARMMARDEVRNDSVFQAFRWHVERVKKVCNRLLDNNANDTKAMFYKGGVIGFLGLVYSERDEVLKAIWDGKEGHDLIQQAVETDPNNYDAKMGLGLFRYLIAKVPKDFEHVIALAGMKGDRYGGLKLLEEAAAKGLYANLEARRWLLDFYRQEDMPDRARNHARVLTQTCRNNWRNALNHVDVVLYQQRRPEEAEPLIESFVTMPIVEASMDRLRFLGRMRMGVCKLYREQWRSALGWYERAWEGTSSAQYKADAALMAGTAADMDGSPKDARLWYDRAASHHGNDDRVKGTWSVSDKAVTRLNFIQAGGRHDRTIAVCDSLASLSAFATADAKGYAAYVRGSALVELGRLQTAEEDLRNAMQSGSSERWLIPFCQWRLGQCYSRQDKTALAKDVLAQALQAEGFANERLLKTRVRRTLANLTKR